MRAPLLESASIQSAKNYRRADVNRALESVFAEYQRELLEEYDLFALEGSYESGSWGEEKVTGRLAFYGAGSMEHDITRLEILTDRGGSPFLVQVEDWVRHRYGLDKLEGLLGNAQIWGGQEQAAEDYRKKEQAGEDHLASLLEEQEQQLPEEENPLDHVEGLRKSPLLSLVMPRDRQVSDKQTDLSGQPSRRSLVSGYGSFDDVAEQGEASRLALGVYLLDHFSCAVPEGDGSGEEAVGPLAYELEYILAGKASDREKSGGRRAEDPAHPPGGQLRLHPDGQREKGGGVRHGRHPVRPSGCAGRHPGGHPGHPVCLVLRGEHRGYPGAPGRPQGPPCQGQRELAANLVLPFEAGGRGGVERGERYHGRHGLQGLHPDAPVPDRGPGRRRPCEAWT